MTGPALQERLSRLFHPDSGRCIDVAIDHGLFGEAALHAGIEDMAAAIDTLVAAGPTRRTRRRRSVARAAPPRALPCSSPART